jgi:2-polyprenyl-3-methyl-5-hydroxy-6-metoxy-1,4-benzoquinol methylase
MSSHRPIGFTGCIPPTRSPRYFDCPRSDLLPLIPASARRVLDIGCGAGRLGESIKARQQAEVFGIELDPDAARVATGRLDQVLVGDVEHMELPFSPGTFDAIICGDVLQHLSDPLHLLRQARTWLTPEGRLIASIPNVRHWSTLVSLLDGNWTQQPAGLLDFGHRQFFTRREIEKLF